jgi:hypothetical protein
MIDEKVIDKGPGRITARLREAYWKLRAHGPPLVTPATYWRGMSDRA